MAEGLRDQQRLQHGRGGFSEEQGRRNEAHDALKGNQMDGRKKQGD